MRTIASLLTFCLLMVASQKALALPVSSGGNYGQGKGGSVVSGSTTGQLVFGVRNDGASIVLAPTNQGTGPLAIDAQGRVQVTGNLSVAVAEAATAEQNAQTDAASLFKLVAGIDPTGLVKALGTNATGVLRTDGSGYVQPTSTVGKAVVDRFRYDYTVPVTTAAYTEVKTALLGTCSELEIFDSSGQTLILATGPAAGEVDQVYILPGGNGRIPFSAIIGTRLSVKAISADADAGELTGNCYQ